MITDIGKHYLYRHIRLDTNEVFYIGIGSKPIWNSSDFEKMYARAFNFTKRNKFWKRIVNKTNYKVEILLESDDYEFIKSKEIEFIKLYGRRDLSLGKLVNMTNGGEGSNGFRHSPETIEKLKNRKMSEKNKERMRNIKGENHPCFGKKLNEEHKKKISEAHKGKTNFLGKHHSEETKAIMRTKKHSEETKNKLRQHWALEAGHKIQHKETKEKFESISEAARKYNILPDTLSWQLRNGAKCIFEYVEESLRKEKILKLNKSHIQIIHKETKEIFSSISKAAQKYNMKEDTLSSQLRNNVKKCKFEYYKTKLDNIKTRENDK